jgi:hypothetical protein
MAPYSLVRASDRVFFLSAKGFYVFVPGGVPTPIGKERVDRTFFAAYDSANLQLVIGASDPQASRVYFTFKSTGGTQGQFDTILAYDYALDRWSEILTSGEYLATLSQPGLTLEGLDPFSPGIISISGAANNGSGAIRLTISGLTAGTGPSNTNLNIENTVTVYGVNGTTEANGTWRFTIIDSAHIDLIGSTFVNAYGGGGSIGGALDQYAGQPSLDNVSNAALSQVAAVSTLHALGFFSGANLEAQVDTSEQVIAGSRRVRVKGFRPVTDAATCYGAISARETAQAAANYSAEQAVNARGLCPANVSTRLARAHVRIASGTNWTYAMGAEPIFAQEGVR